jgi:hypothetical protein
MKIKKDLDGNPIKEPVKCIHCGYRKGLHQATTLNCPFNAKPFTWFYEDKFYTPKETK